MSDRQNLATSNCERAFVQRDFSQGTAVRFITNPMPPELTGRLNPDSFARAITEINKLFDEAESISSAVFLENCIGCFTAYLTFLCIQTHYEKVLKKITNLVINLNEKVFRPNDLLLIDPSERGLRVVSTTF